MTQLKIWKTSVETPAFGSKTPFLCWKILVLRGICTGKSLDLGFGSCFGVPRLEPWKKRTEEVQEAFQKDVGKKRASQMHNAFEMQRIATSPEVVV